MNRSVNPTWFCVIALPVLIGVGITALLALDGQPLWVRYLVTLFLAYFMGAVPWGYCLMRWSRGIDVREYGSGRTGMTNVLRTGGGRMAVAVLALDLSKGILAVLLAREVLGSTAGEVAAGLAALAGHNWPVFLGFRGGRGIATGLGSLVMMAPVAAVIAALVFVPIVLLSRYLSLGSVIGVATAAAALLLLAWLGMYSSIYGWYAVIGSGTIIWQHRDNIQRLLQGTERRLGVPATKIN